MRDYVNTRRRGLSHLNPDNQGLQMLFFYHDKDKSMQIYTSADHTKLIHRDLQESFEVCSIFAHSRLCLVREETSCAKSIRSVKDWSLVNRVDEDERGWWMTRGLKHDDLLRVRHDSVELWDCEAKAQKGTMQHHRIRECRLADEDRLLVTANEDRGHCSCRRLESACDSVAIALRPGLLVRIARGIG